MNNNSTYYNIYTLYNLINISKYEKIFGKNEISNRSKGHIYSIQKRRYQDKYFIFFNPVESINFYQRKFGSF